MNYGGDIVRAIRELSEFFADRCVDRALLDELIARLPFVPSGLEWLHAGRASTVMSTDKAKSQLGWAPKCGFRELVEMMVDADLARHHAAGQRAPR